MAKLPQAPQKVASRINPSGEMFMNNWNGDKNLTTSFDIRDLDKNYYELRSSDTLLNKRAFQDYWKSRQKHKKATVNNYEIGYINDVDGDGQPEWLAYETDVNNKKRLVGYNQYYLTPPKDSEKYYKTQFYQKGPRERAAIGGYPSYFRDEAAYQDGFLELDDFNEKKSDAQAKPLFRLFKYLQQNNAGSFNDRDIEEQHRMAAFLLDCIKESFFDVDVNPKHKAFLKSKGGLTKYYKEFIDRFLKGPISKAQGTVDAIHEGISKRNKDGLANWLRTNINYAHGYYISGANAEDLYIRIIERKLRSGAAPAKIDRDERLKYETKMGWRNVDAYGAQKP